MNNKSKLLKLPGGLKFGLLIYSAEEILERRGGPIPRVPARSLRIQRGTVNGISFHISASGAAASGHCDAMWARIGTRDSGAMFFLEEDTKWDCPDYWPELIGSRKVGNVRVFVQMIFFLIGLWISWTRTQPFPNLRLPISSATDVALVLWLLSPFRNDDHVKTFREALDSRMEAGENKLSCSD